MKKILVPISFSKSSRVALHQASVIASQSKAALDLLHCYPVQKYNRDHDFGDDDYDKGIKEMLVGFYAESARKDKCHFITYEGAVSDFLSEQGDRYDLLVLCRRAGSLQNSKYWFNDKFFYFTTKARCPVLIVSGNQPEISFSGLKNIWLIERQEKEAELVKNELAKLRINPDGLEVKSLRQKTFVSTFWKNVVTRPESLSQGYVDEISESFYGEGIDLFVLVNHRKGVFERFIKGDVFQIISQFEIPILIFQASS